MLRVGLLTGEYPPLRGGIADYCQRLALELRHLGVQLGVEVEVATSPAGRSPTRPEWVLPVVDSWNYSLWPRVRRLAAERGWDLLHIQYQPAAYGLRAAVNALPLLLRVFGAAGGGRRAGVAREGATARAETRTSRLKVVTTFHDLRTPYLFPKAGPLRRQAVALLARASDAAICVAPEDLPAVQSWAAADVCYIPVGNNLDRGPPQSWDRAVWRARLGVSEGGVLLAHLGFVNRSKAVHELLLALGTLRARAHNVWLAMVGDETGSSDPTNAAYAEEVRALTAELGLSERVRWTGYQAAEMVAGFLRCADVAVLPFVDGASGRRTTLLACLSHGLPVVTVAPAQGQGARVRDQGLQPLVHGEHVYLVEGAYAGPLVEGIEAVLGDAQMRARLSAQGQAYAAQFAWPDIARQTLAVYERVTGQGAGRKGG